MTDRRNVKFEIIEHRGGLQQSPPQQNLAKVKRWQMKTLLFTMAIIVIVGVSFAPDKTLKTSTLTKNQYADTSNPVFSPEISALKGQFVGLVSGSIENKLKTLEDNIRKGAVPNSLGTIQDLKNDVQMLRAYSNPATPDTPPVSNAQLRQEVSHLRNLIYLTLGSCGLMIAAIAGVWLKNRKKLPFPQKEIITRYLGKL